MMTRIGRRRFPVLLAAIAALLVFIAVDAASSPVQAQTPSADASLKSLSLSDSLGDDIELSPEFSAATSSYTTDDDELASSVTSTTVTAETTNEDATAVIMINGVEDADGAVDLVAGYNDITVEVTAEDGTTTRTYTVTVLRAAEDTSTSTDDTITSLLSRLDVEAVDGTSNQIAGYKASPSQGSLSPAGFNYPAGFGRWYTVEALAVEQGQSANSAPTSVAISVRGTVTSVESSGNDRAHVLPEGADIDLRLDTDEFTRTYSLKSATRTVAKCSDVDEDGKETLRDCRVGETATETYKWTTTPPPRLADDDKVIVRLRYSAPEPGKPGRPLVTAPEGKSGALVVNWIAPGSDDPKVRGYEVLLSPAPGQTGATGVIKVTGGSTTRLPVLLLEPGTAYDVRVRARSGLATGPWSDTVRARTNPLQGTNSVSVELDLDGVTKVKVGDRLYKRLKVTGMNNLHADAFPEWFEGYYQGSFVEFRVLGGIHDSYEYEDLTHGYGEGAFYAGALTIGEDGEVYHNFGYEVIAEGRAEGEKGTGAPEYGPLYLWLESTSGQVSIGRTANSRATALCVEIADDSNSVPTGRECPDNPVGSAGHVGDRLTGRFVNVPQSHDGESEFTVRLAFVEDVGISPTSLREDALAATGGAVTRVQRVDDRSDLFEITVAPDSDEDVTITLSSSGDCGESGAVCTQEEDPRQLYNSPTATVAGPILTASFQGLPSQHDGETAFSFRIAFNDEIATDEEDFRDHSVEVWGGEVTRAAPVGQRRDLWEVEVEPASDDSVMVSLKPAWSCAATGAVCTAGGRLLSVIPATMVPGPATWPVQVTGVAQVGKTLTADSSNLSERYGVQVTSMTYQWLANAARVPGANARTYKPDDGKQGKKISVMATYTDDRGNEETVTSGPTEPLAARDRIRRATGLPVISGRALVGHTLTADKSLIIDANGLENAVFYYFWEADDDSIPGATGTTYTPVEADVGKVITVIVAYVDDSGRGQSMTSPATLPVMTEEAAAAAEFRESLRYVANADGSVTLHWNAPDDEVTGYRILRSRHTLGEREMLVYVSDTGGTATTFTDTGLVAGVPHSYRVQAIRDGELGERTKSFKTKVFPLRKPTNSPATGAPAIGGTAQVGETLTADISGIADEDGLENVTKDYLWAAIGSSGVIGAKYAYQWLVDGADSGSGDHHAGYDNTTYTLTEDDVGKAMSVRVTFVDDAGYQETLTSAATDPVAAAPQPNSPARGAPTIGGTAQVGETLTADTSGITDEDGLDDSTFTHQWVREDSVMVASAARSYTPTDGDRGKAIKVRVSFTDNAGNPETRTSTQTATVEARANSPATGAPTISGTAVVGETLTADITGIADADGLTNVSYDYQWLADDAEIAGATGLTYTLADDDAGKAIRVRVSFTDDAGNPETRTSAATAAVAAMPNSPATGAPFISGMARENHVLRAHTLGIADADGLTNVSFAYQWLADDAKIAGANGSTYTLTDSEESKAIKVQVSFTDDAGYTESLRSSSTATVQAASQCSGTGTGPTPTSIEVEAVPIVVESTNDKYYVLYVRHELDADTTVEIPVSVTLGQAGTTTLTEQLSALPAERYRVDEFLIAEPGDLDGDCIDDITELGDPAGMNPLNPAPAVEPVDGVVAIPDRETFEALSYQGRRVVIDKHLRGLEFVKFYLFLMDTDRPVVYFMNTETHRAHTWFGYVIGLWDNPLWLQGAMRGEIVYHPNVVAPDGSLGVYRFEFEPQDAYSFEAVAYAYEVLAASMPLIDDNFAYYPMPARALPLYHEERALFDDSRVNVLLEEDIFPDVDFISLNKAEGYGFLRVMALEERPNPRDVVIYETLPNELSRVAGIITTVPQTPLSHVNLRAVQDGVPNAFIRDALDDDDIDDLIDSYVHYTVAGYGWTLRAATPAEVDAHYAASRPAQTQTPERDLAVTQITALSDIGFGDWTAFGVKAANVAVLGTLGFGDGTAPDGFAVPFHFYDEFMRHNEFYDKIEEMLADTDFQSDFDTQESELKKLRKKIKKGETPEWIIEALEDMHATYPDGQSLRYRSSTNNEDLPGFSGAGLYDSKTQDPDETAEDGIDKSIKGVWASMWNFRAFTERELHRIDHLAAAMGVLVHPNYSDELANGVAVSFDPFGRRDGSYYVNTQLGEDLVTNPEAHSVPEEMLLHPDGTYTVTARSNQVPAGQLLMSDAQLGQLRRHLEAIHDEFKRLYKPCSGEPFAMEIEFKITSENILAIKQARPWVFNVPSSESAGDNSATGAPRISGTAQVGETLTADTSCIKDPDGLENATFSYQWQADGTAIQDATDATYTLVEVDEGKAITVRVSFTDDAGDDETLTSAPTAAVAASPNTPATGAPTISGTAQVGETLTAGITGIADADGLSGETFTYQWVSSDGTTDTDVENATGSTYKLVAADQGKAIKVRVTFTDDGGNEETLTSAPTAPVWGDGPPGAPGNLTATAGDKEVTLSWDPPADNGNAPATRYRIEWRIDGKDYGSSQWGTSRETTYTTNDQANLANGVKYFFRVKAENGNGNSYGPYGPASDEVSATPTSGSAVDLGTPVLSDTEDLHHGMVQLDWQDIEDAGWYVVQYYHLEDGEWLDLPAVGVDIAFHGSSAVVSNLDYGIHWLRVGAASCAGASEWSQIEELYGTNASDWEGVPVPEVEEGDQTEPCPVVLGTPVLSEPEYLHHGMVQLDWQDIEDAGWYVVQYYHLEGGEWLDLPAEGVEITFHGSSAVVSNLHGLSWLRVGAASCDGASEWSQIEQLFGTNASDWEGVPVPELEEGDEIEPCSEDADTPDNSPATGAPTISGTAQVGETLTANTSGVADADGLGSVQYEYQWLADDSDISGATNATYTLAAEDEGKAIKVQVDFTDDQGNEESLTSGATDAVDARPNSPATGAPTIRGTAQVGETLTADTSGIADADGLSNVQYEYQWLADDTDIAGATNATYTLTDSEESKAISVQVSFTDDADNEETLTSAATAAVAGAQPTEPPAKPRKLSATAIHDSVTLTWDDPGDDTITGYVILRRIPGVDPQGHFDVLVANTGTAATTYTDNTVSAETRYTYRIKAINGAGTSERSRWFHIDTPAAPVPAKPTGLEATESHGQVVLTWDDPGDDSITGYVILRRVRENNTGGDFDVLVADTGSAATTYTDDTVAASTTYTYRIKAINEHGTSERSRWSHIDIPAAP